VRGSSNDAPARPDRDATSALAPVIIPASVIWWSYEWIAADFGSNAPAVIAGQQLAIVVRSIAPASDSAPASNQLP
jgi:hypothetical protein